MLVAKTNTSFSFKYGNVVVRVRHVVALVASIQSVLKQWREGASNWDELLDFVPVHKKWGTTLQWLVVIADHPWNLHSDLSVCAVVIRFIAADIGAVFSARSLLSFNSLNEVANNKGIAGRSSEFYEKLPYHIDSGRKQRARWMINMHTAYRCRAHRKSDDKKYIKNTVLLERRLHSMARAGRKKHLIIRRKPLNIIIMIVVTLVVSSSFSG